MAVKKTKEQDVVKAVDHAFDVLEAFNGKSDELGVTELSKTLGLSKNNVFRLKLAAPKHHLFSNRAR